MGGGQRVDFGKGVPVAAERRQKVRRKDLLFPEESYAIKAACIAVHEELGCGFLEKVYENALAHELRKRSFAVTQQAAFQVFYDKTLVGDFVADLLVDEKIIVEVKATREDHRVHLAQLINYLKAAGIPLGLLVNFGKERFDFKRVVFTKQ